MTTIDLPAALKELKLTTFRDNYKTLATTRKTQSHIDYLTELCEEEIDYRHQKRLTRLLKGAKLPRLKSLDEFDHKRIPNLKLDLLQQIAKGDCLELAENIIMLGNPGTGKTHLCLAFAQEWCMQGRRVLYTTPATLIQELLRAKQELSLDRYIKRLDKYQALIIDDISYIPCERHETDLLFTLLAARYEMRSTIITSNEPFSNWDKIFKDKTTTSAVIDRLVHHSTILQLNAESYRLETAKKKSARKNAKEVMK